MEMLNEKLFILSQGGGGGVFYDKYKVASAQNPNLKSNFESVVTIFVLCCIRVPNFRKRGQVYDL